MTIEEKLKYYILSKYKSIRAFSQDVDIPYSTIDNIFKRSISGSSLYNITQICDKLSIDINKLAENEICQVEAQEADTRNSILTVIEQSIIKKHQLLNEEGQEYIQSQMDYALSQQKYKKHNQLSVDDQKQA